MNVTTRAWGTSGARPPESNADHAPQQTAPHPALPSERPRHRTEATNGTGPKQPADRGRASEDQPRGGEGAAPRGGGGGREGGAGRGPFVLTDAPLVRREIGSQSCNGADSGRLALFVKPLRSGAFYANDERVRGYEGGGYLQDSYPVPASVHAALVAVLTDSLGREPNADEVRLVGHVWLVGALRRDQDAEGFVPIPWQVLASDAPTADLDALVYGGVLDMTEHSHTGGRCREWAVAPSVSEPLDAALAAATGTARYVNLFTGRPRRGRPVGSQRHDEARNPHPPIVTAAMDAIPLGIINLPSVEAHLARLRAAIGEAATEGERVSARARWLNDALCVAWIKARGLTPTDVAHIYTYPHAWDVQKGGRIMPLKGGGAQSLSREGKAAMYADVDGVRNYDLLSSQPRILSAELDAIGIECEWLDAYLSDDRAKYAAAERVRVSVDAWKACFMAAVTGGAAGIPKRFELKPVTRYVAGEDVRIWRPVCAAMRTLEDEMGGERARKVWPAVRAELDELLRAIRHWHRYLCEEWVPANRKHGRRGSYVENAAGMRLYLDDYSPRELPRKVAAFVLQGREAQFIHTLATLGPAHGFRVVGHEHDGLVTLGAIPAEAIREAQRVCGMPFAELVEKPFC